MRVNGPYVHQTGRLQGRKYVQIFTDDGKKTTMLYSRWLMQEHLGYELGYDETVDHKDEDPTNDALENLQILTRSENSRKATENNAAPLYEFICPGCGAQATRLLRQVRRNWALGKAGPFCGKVCAGRASRSLKGP